MKGRQSSSSYEELLAHLTRDRLEHNNLQKLILEADKKHDDARKAELQKKLSRIKNEIEDLKVKISALDKETGYHHSPSSPSFAKKRPKTTTKNN